MSLVGTARTSRLGGRSSNHAATGLRSPALRASPHYYVLHTGSVRGAGDVVGSQVGLQLAEAQMLSLHVGGRGLVAAPEKPWYGCVFGP